MKHLTALLICLLCGVVAYWLTGEIVWGVVAAVGSLFASHQRNGAFDFMDKKPSELFKQ
jgi:hypothetical protein